MLTIQRRKATSQHRPTVVFVAVCAVYEEPGREVLGIGAGLEVVRVFFDQARKRNGERLIGASRIADAGMNLET